MNYEEMKEIAQNYLCEVCEMPLVIRQDAAKNERVLSCGNNHAHQGFKRVKSATELYKSGEPILIEIINKLPAARQAEAARSNSVGAPLLYPRMLREDIGEKKLLSPEDRLGLIQYAAIYGLDAFLGHVCLMYGEPYITAEGYFYNAKRSNKKFSLASMPMSDAQRIVYQAPQGSFAWLCFVKSEQMTEPVLGIGIVTAEELTEEARGKPGQLRYPVVAAHPTLMAQKRAEWQALRRAFPLEAIK